MNVHSRGDLQQFQSLPLHSKIRMTQRRIKDWYDFWGGDVYVSFSGGKDSTVLLHIARELYPNIEAVFVDTGLEFPEIRRFVKSFENVTVLRPTMRFDEVIKRYGYPLVSKSVANCVRGAKRGQQSRINRLNELRCDGAGKSIYSNGKYKPLLDVDFSVSEQCCDVMKKRPAQHFQKQTGKKPILATMSCESMLREKNWFKYGCNAFESKNPQSTPMAFWTEQDILQFIKITNIPIASVYGEVVYEKMPEQYRLEEYGFTGCGIERLTTTGCNRTGCIFCGFGCHLEKEPSRFQRLKETHPK